MILLGVFLVIDGVLSLWVFRKQACYCQLVRLVRFIIGIVLIKVGL